MSSKNRPKDRWVGRVLPIASVASRFAVLLLLFFLALMTDYVNLKQGYNNARLVELSEGKNIRRFYQGTDAVFSRIGEPLQVAQSNGGMTWSIRILGVPFTDPVAAASVLASHGRWTRDLAIGLLIPLSIMLVFGRVFCAYVCPASLLFFTIGRVRRYLKRWLLLPEFQPNRALAWGILAGGLTTAMIVGHGIWTLLLPYLAIGQVIFSGVAFGTLSVCAAAIATFATIDLVMGQQFTCRHLCPTGRLIGVVGARPLVSVRRDAEACISACTSCADVCPLQVSPKLDQTRDCSLCGECIAICPAKCLSVGLKRQTRPEDVGATTREESAA